MRTLKSLLTTFDSVYQVAGLARRLQEGEALELSGLPGSSKALLLASLLQGLDRGVLLVTRNNREAADLITDLSQFTDQEVHLLPAKETLPYDDTPPAPDSLMRRVRTLHAMLQGRGGLVVVPVRAFLEYLLPRRVLRSSLISLSPGDAARPGDLALKLAALGYERAERVSAPGTFSLRGDIIDVFGNGMEHPVRIELFDDTVEELRFFSPLTQRSTEPATGVTLLPVTDLVVDRVVRERLEGLRSDQNRDVVDQLLEGGAAGGTEHHLPLLYPDPETVLDYAGGRYHLMVNSPEACREMAVFFAGEARRIYGERRARFLLPPGQVLLSFDDLLGRSPCTVLTPLPEDSDGSYNFRIQEKRTYRGQIRHFKEEVSRLLAEGYRVIIGSFYEGQTNRIRDLLGDLLGRWDALSVQTLDLNEGFLSREMKLAVIMDREIFNRRRRHRARTARVASEPIEGIAGITPGEFIVHVEHGIGIYRGMERLSTGGAEKDFVKIEYREGDEIFIPVDQINLLQKYIGQEGRRPRIDKIGSGTWNKVKEHVRKSVRNMARDLLELYSVRTSM
jgi:transcription-repair coupling factor (superfamily II helicase)